MVDVNELHALRCCSDTKLNNAFMKNGGGCRVWHNSFYGRVTGGGNHAGCVKAGLSFKDGWQFCKDMGARLCTKAEVEAGCVKGSGCGTDAQTIWAVPNADDATITDFCNFFNSNEMACKAAGGCTFNPDAWLCSTVG